MTAPSVAATRPPTLGAVRVEALLSDDDRRSLLRYLRLSLGRGFRLAVVELRTPHERRALLAWLRGEVVGARFHEVDLRALPGVNLWDELLRWYRDADVREGDALVLHGLEEAPDVDAARPALFQQLNVQRDLFVRDLKVPWILCVHPAIVAKLQTVAPDFCDFVTSWTRALGGDEAPGPREIAPALATSLHRLPATDMSGWPPLLIEASRAINHYELDRARDLLISFQLSDESRRYDGVVSYLRGRIASARGEYGAARTLLQEALNELASAGMSSLRAEVFRQQARMSVIQGDVAQALALYREALSASEELGDPILRAATLEDLARILTSQGEIDSALAMHRGALSIFEALGDKRARAIALGSIARILATRGEFEQALTMHREEIADYKELGDEHSRASVLGDVARILEDQGDVDQAILMYRESLSLFEALGDPLERVVALAAVARVLETRGEVGQALAHYQELLAVSEQLGHQDGIANACWSIGLIRAQRGNFSEALKNVARAYEILQRIGRVDALATVGVGLAKLLANARRPEEARTVLQRSITLFEKLGWAADVASARALLAQTEPAPTAAPPPSAAR